MIEKFIYALMPFVGLGILLGFLLLAMNVILARERVKTELQKRKFNLIYLRWRLLDTLIFWSKSCLGANFDVVYSDASGKQHRAICLVFGHTGKVEWRKDEIVSTEPRA